MSEFWHIILGSVLAFSGGLVAYFIQFYHSRNEQRKLIRGENGERGKRRTENGTE